MISRIRTVMILLLLLSAITGLAYFFELPRALAQVDEGTDDEFDEDFLLLDEIPPSVKITNPPSCSNSIMSPGIVVVRGVASDDLSGVNKVEAFSDTYPLDETFPFEMATPASQGDWSSWSIPVEIYDTKTRILVRATDNAGNENWNEVIIDIEEARQKQRSRDSPGAVAFVEPSFTTAAYNVDGFYEFYGKYQDVDFGQDITDDLQLMTADIPADLESAYFAPILQRVKDFVSADVETTIIGDTDIHDGFIFRNDGSNAYEALFLLHNEYVTQQEYDNLRRFTANGGNIVFLDGNLFYGEVSYDRTYCTATLIKGHNWEFDGKVARRSVSERYFEENREWLGSNYMINSLSDPVSFKNNPFNYTHFEENYVTNPNAKILHDYGLTIGDGYGAQDWHRNATIATYELDHGKGKNIVLGIYSEKESDDPAFLNFFENVVLMHALGNEYKVQAGDQEYSIYWKMDSGSVTQVATDSESGKLTLSINRTGNADDILRILLPKALIDVSDGSSGEGSAEVDEDVDPASLPSSNGYQENGQDRSQMRELLVTTLTGNGVARIDRVTVDQEATDYERIIEVPMSEEVSVVEIYGAHVTPEFRLAEMLFILSAATVASSLSVTMIFLRSTKVSGR